VRYEPSQYCSPLVIRLDPNLCFLYKVNCIDDDIFFADVNEIKGICVSMDLEEGHFISPMPNVFNMF